MNDRRINNSPTYVFKTSQTSLEIASELKTDLKRVQNLYPTLSCHIGRNWTECWMKILII